jgi:hypothetical protein
MLTWMRSPGQRDHVDVAATGTYGAGLLRRNEAAGVCGIQRRVELDRVALCSRGSKSTLGP